MPRKKTVSKIEEKAKPIESPEVAPEVISEEKETSDKYYEDVGRRKTAVARVRLYTKKKDILVNEKDYKIYFSLLRLQKVIESPFEKMKCPGKFGATIKVKGGGLKAQSEAIRLGISRALVKFNPDFKRRLRRAGFLTRDSRMVERKKFGLKKARRAPQWSKR